MKGLIVFLSLYYQLILCCQLSFELLITKISLFLFTTSACFLNFTNSFLTTDLSSTDYWVFFRSSYQLILHYQLLFKLVTNVYLVLLKTLTSLYPWSRKTSTLFIYLSYQQLTFTNHYMTLSTFICTIYKVLFNYITDWVCVTNFVCFFLNLLNGILCYHFSWPY